MTAREWWKQYYRQLRIIRRESAKAAWDCMLYGTGACVVGEHFDDLIEHVPIQELYNDLGTDPQ